MYFSGFNIQNRHSFLLDTIGTLDMEDTASTQALLFCIFCPILTISLSTFQYILFNLYNNRYHPFSMILEESKRAQENSSPEQRGEVNDAFEVNTLWGWHVNEIKKNGFDSIQSLPYLPICYNSDQIAQALQKTS